MVKKQRQPLRNRKSNKIRNMVKFVLVNINRRYSESNNLSKWKVFNQAGKVKKALEKFESLAIIAKETKIFLSMRILQCYRLSSQKFDDGDVYFQHNNWHNHHVCVRLRLSMDIRDKSCCISFLLHCVSVSNLKQQLPLQQEQYGGMMAKYNIRDIRDYTSRVTGLR